MIRVEREQVQIDRTKGDHKREEIIRCALGALAKALHCFATFASSAERSPSRGRRLELGVVKDNRAASSET